MTRRTRARVRVFGRRASVARGACGAVMRHAAGEDEGWTTNAPVHRRPNARRAPRAARRAPRQMLPARPAR